MKKCLVCGVKYTPKRVHQKYCSIKCRSKDYYNKYYKHFEWKRKIKCPICNSEFIPNTVNQKYCLNPCDAKIAWKNNNREQDLEGRRQYNYRRRLDPEKYAKDLKCRKRWRKNNPDKRKYYKYKRRAVINLINNFTEKQWREMKEFYNNKCLCCNEELPLSLDHIIPLSKKGTHSHDNIQPLCIRCNGSKQDKIIDYRWIADV